jgi:UDP-N-acetylglucosamine/UDP-N-acetylgalactosamine 4-epimerase
VNRFEEIKEELLRNPRTWLVTGVAGFIGSNLLETLLDLNQLVVGLDNFSSGYRRNIDEVLRDNHRNRRAFRLFEGDIRNLSSCREACAGVDYVLHQAALGSVPRSMVDPIVANQINVDGTLNVLVAARDSNVKRVVFASSSAVYGDCTALPLGEDRLGAPLSPYAVSKLTDEKYAQVFSSAYRLSTVALRYFNVFGPRQDPLGSYAAVIPQWIHALLSNESCRIHGDGNNTRDFVAIQDVVQANILAATTPLGEGEHRVYNVGAGRRTSLNELHTMLSRALVRLQPGQRVSSAIHDEPRDGDIRHSQAEVARIVGELGYAPAPDLNSALEATMSWYLKRLSVRQILALTA